ncbi:hypothetical protein BpHYR1_006343 [Brachionus plicatilis]|uniref:Uncharacterized protein n=1 Tax=Brachionus plicatilis TaxID=10195 RepID=A0A3M7RIJ2_BRAPC|nr:hypothetical protein BpHYR1_006343 [Brachionus plicatilis]
MLENDKQNQTLSPKISILVTNESNETKFKKEQLKLFRNIEPLFTANNHNWNYRKCLSRLNLNDIRPELRIPPSNVKQLGSPVKLKKKSLLNLNSKNLQLRASNSNLYKSSSSLNALDLEMVDTFSIGSFDRYSFYSLYSTNDLESKDFIRTENSLNNESMHLEAKNNQPLDKQFIAKYVFKQSCFSQMCRTILRSNKFFHVFDVCESLYVEERLQNLNTRYSNFAYGKLLFTQKI